MTRPGIPKLAVLLGLALLLANALDAAAGVQTSQPRMKKEDFNYHLYMKGIT